MNDNRVDSQDRWHQSIYDELHRIAQRAMERESPDHTLQPTVLVDDAYLQLLKQNNVAPSQRTHLIAAGATIIRRLLVDHARKRKAKKRGGGAGRGISLKEDQATQIDDIDILELNEALERLAEVNPRAAAVTELKFFGGLTGSEIASELNVSRVTAQSEWKFARNFLKSILAVEN